MVTATRTTELDMQGMVERAAKRHQWRVFHQPHVAKRAEPGFQDLVLLRQEPDGRKRMILMELKIAPNTLEPEQICWRDEADGAIVETQVWTAGSSDPLAIKATVEAIEVEVLR